MGDRRMLFKAQHSTAQHSTAQHNNSAIFSLKYLHARYGLMNKDIVYFTGAYIPDRADELEEEFKKSFGDNILRRIWPKLSAVSAIWAGNFHSYARKIQDAFTGRAIPFYTMSYASSEGMFAVARHPFDQCYCMIPKSCFFEFIPMDGKGSDAEEDNPKTLLMDELEDGKEYELVITNQSGF